MSLARYEDWPERLFNYIESRTYTPFQWGVNDCATFASGAVEAMTGETIFEPTYANAFEAATLMDSLGGVEAHMTSLFGEPVAPLQARRGDVGMLVLEDRELLCVVIGDRVVAPGEESILFYPVTMISKAWRV